jgi:TatD DNase family protein
MIDTHTHLYLDDFEDGGRSVVSCALDAGVKHMIFPNVDSATVDALKSLHSLFPKETSVAAGLHPTSVDADWRRTADDIFQSFKDLKICAVGEIGMDLHWDPTFRNEQMQLFEYQLRKAKEMNLPVIIHCRQALDETLEVIQGMAGDMPEAVFHSFTGSPADVERIRETGDFYFGINGVVTFKNAEPLRESLKLMDKERIVLETDSPYLAPVPNRGKRNESAYIVYVCRKIGEVLGLSEDEVSRITDENAMRLFNL